MGYYWESENPFLGELAGFFCRLLDAETRLGAANPAININSSRAPLDDPIHYLQRYDDIEVKISGYFKQAFDLDIMVHRNAGTEVPLHVGNRPVKLSTEDRLTHTYQNRLEALPRLNEQGDGMRSFVGILLNSLVVNHSIVLIDEPEAFLHPPQARLLSRMLSREKQTDRQLFLSTHSGDVLRGLLDADAGNVRVVRLQRDGNVNRVSELKNEDIEELWNDPLLRYSNILDGVFHERVVVCESDADCRFYNAIMDVMFDSREDNKYRPDIMFVHGGGKQRTPTLIKALRALEVPVTAIFDFDILNDEYNLRLAYETLGGHWADIEKEWVIFSKNIGNKQQPTLQKVYREIEQIFEEYKGEQNLSDKIAKEIREAISVPSPWRGVKKSGESAVPSGDATNAYNRLKEQLEGKGCFIVPVGELEGFVRSVGGKSGSWLNEVLKKDLKNDSHLDEAKKFIDRIFLPHDLSKPKNESTLVQG